MIVKKKFPIPDMDLETIRDNIVSKLHAFLDLPVVMVENISEMPAYPFVTYKFIVSYNISGQGGTRETHIVDSLDARFTKDFEETIKYQPQMTLSITANASTELESSKVAQKAHDWFKHVGYYDLQDTNTSVVSTEGFSNRSALTVDEYTHRVGFDVILRTSDKIKRRLETIEEFNIEEVK